MGAGSSNRKQGNDEIADTRTIDWAAASHAFVPQWLRTRALVVTVETPKRVYAPEEPVPFTVEFHNRLPIPIRLQTTTPRRWTWTVDGLTNASHYRQPIPDRPATLSFSQGERKRFHRHWSGRIRTSKTQWTAAKPGTHTLEVALTVPDASTRGLTAETTVEILES